MKASPHAFLLRYGWTAWPTRETHLPSLPAFPIEAWKNDGLHLLEHKWTDELVQLVVSATPTIAPVDIARLLKGRVQHALRLAGTPVEFSRKIAIRSLGDNTRQTVERYIRDQHVKGDFADPRYRDALQAHSFTDSSVRLDEPDETKSGRYWYNLHVVLVASDRWRMAPESASSIANVCRGQRVAKLSVMPDHLHLAVKGDPAISPQQIATEFQKVTAKASGMLGFWKDTFYVGTFGEYSMAAVRSD